MVPPAVELKQEKPLPVSWRKRGADGAELLATLLLEVLGGCGAIWGCSEYLGIRRGNNVSAWRAVSGAVGLWCFSRWMSVRVLKEPPNEADTVLTFFILEVLGGAGAVWGCLEIAGYRAHYPTDCRGTSVDGAWAPGYHDCLNTYAQCRAITSVFFGLFLLRFRWAMSREKRSKRRVRIFGSVLPSLQAACTAGLSENWVRGVGAAVETIVSFVLDVCGGAGALWGASEVAYLRKGWGDSHYGQPSFDCWRLACAFTFGLCLLRWIRNTVCALDVAWRDSEYPDGAGLAADLEAVRVGAVVEKDADPRV